jgi:hypothetical protein
LGLFDIVISPGYHDDFKAGTATASARVAGANSTNIVSDACFVRSLYYLDDTSKRHAPSIQNRNSLAGLAA